MADGGLEGIVGSCDSLFSKDPEATVSVKTDPLVELYAKRLEKAIQEDGRLTLHALEEIFGSLF